MSMSEDSKQKAWLEHYQRLLNVEFDWNPDHLSDKQPVEGQPIPITIDMAKKAISQMKAGKAPGPSGIVVKMIRAAHDMDTSLIHDLHDGNVCILRLGVVSFIASTKGKGDALDRGNYRNYRSLKLREQVMSPGEDCGWPHQTAGVNRRFPLGFIPGRGTTDAIFVFRQLQKKYLAANKRLHGFHRPGEGVWLSSLEGHQIVVGVEKT